MAWTDVETNKNGEEREQIPYTKFSEGNTMIRVLDNEPFSFWQHWLNAQATSVTCLGKDCPICEIIRQAKSNKVIAPYNNSHRHALRIWNYNTNQMEIMIQGKGFMSQLLMLHKEVGDITTYDIKIIRKGKDTSTTYMAMPSAPAPFDAEGKEIIEVNLEEKFAPPTREVMMQLIEGKTWAEIAEENNENVA